MCYIMKLVIFNYHKKSSISDLYLRLTLPKQLDFLYGIIYTVRAKPLKKMQRVVIKWVQPPHSPSSCHAITQDWRKMQHTTTIHTIAKKLKHFWASLYKCLPSYCVSSQPTRLQIFLFLLQFFIILQHGRDDNWRHFILICKVFATTKYSGIINMIQHLLWIIHPFSIM